MHSFLRTTFPTACAGVAIAVVSYGTSATEPCGDFGECKALIEINSSDGDVGFHFLSDGDDLSYAQVRNPRGRPIFAARARSEFADQKFTELFVESTEPLCFDPLEDDDPDNDDEEFRTIEEFLELWTPGTYTFIGRGPQGERSRGSTELEFDLPAAPQNLAYSGGVITWTRGNDLGECADAGRLQGLVDAGTLPEHPADVTVAAWEIVLEPDVEDGDPVSDEFFSIRISGDSEILSVSVPFEYLSSLPDDTPAKLEIGAIGEGDNATFTELGDICLNESAGCDDDDDDS
jgi:hypothetical protein